MRVPRPMPAMFILLANCEKLHAWKNRPSVCNARCREILVLSAWLVREGKLGVASVHSRRQYCIMCEEWRSFLCLVTLTFNLPMWSSGQSTRAPCAVERDVLSGRGSYLSSGASSYHRITSNSSYSHDKQEDNPGQEKKNLTVSSINCDRCWCLD